MKIDIKKCPFCGNDAELIHAQTAHTNAKVVCTNCSASVYATTETQALNQWNGRFQPASNSIINFPKPQAL
jgi:Lar family restriction alleviation protein